MTNVERDKNLVRNVLVAVAVLLLVGLAYGGLGWPLGRILLREEAIEHNAAEWTIDPKTGVRTFEWRGSLEKQDEP